MRRQLPTIQNPIHIALRDIANKQNRKNNQLASHSGFNENRNAISK